MTINDFFVYVMMMNYDQNKAGYIPKSILITSCHRIYLQDKHHADRV